MATLKQTETPKEQLRPGLERYLIYTGELMTVVIDFTNGPWDKPEPPHKHPHVQTLLHRRGRSHLFL